MISFVNTDHYNRELDKYVRDCRTEIDTIREVYKRPHVFTHTVLDNAMLVWDRLCKEVQNKSTYLSYYRQTTTYYHFTDFIHTPCACVGENDNFMFSWKNDIYYLEIEVFGNSDNRSNECNVELFGYPKYASPTFITELWGEDITINDSFSSMFLFLLVSHFKFTSN